MQCKDCGELLDERYLKLHRDRFCIGYETSFKQMLAHNKWYRRAFYGYIASVFIVGGWVLWFWLSGI